MHLVPLALVVLASLSTAENLAIGEKYVTMGKPAKALPLLKRALNDKKLTPAKRAQGLAALGLAQLQLKKAKDAVASLEESATLVPKKPRTWLLLGAAYDANGDIESAVKAYQRGSKANPNATDLHHELGMTLLEAGETEPAVRALEQAAKLAGNRPTILTDLAFAYAQQGAHAKAKESAQRAVSLAPDSADAYYVLGDSEAALKNTKGARRAYKEALKQDAMHTPTLYHLGLLEVGAGDHKNAARAFLRLVKIDPGNRRARARLGVSLAKIGKDKKALKLLKEAVTTMPDNISVRAALAEVSDRAEDFKTAETQWRAVAKLSKRNSPQAKAALERATASRKARKEMKSKRKSKGK